MAKDEFFGKGLFAGNRQPINPAFGQTGMDWRVMHHPGDPHGQAPFGPNNGRRNGSRANATLPRMLPKGLLAGDAEGEDPTARAIVPANFIADVDIDNNWFSPFQPVTPFGPPYITDARDWDYPVGMNIDYWPKRMQNFSMMRSLAESWGILATLVEARIDELVGMDWAFKLKDDKKDSDKDPRIKELYKFFQKPDKQRPYPIWMRMIFRDRYQIDAASVYIRRNRLEQEPYALEALDGATIKPLIDDEGRIPTHPQPGYQQLIKGLPFNNFTARELLYMPARPRTNLPIFGYSEVEQVMLEATEGIKKTLYQVNFWNEGTIPDMMIAVPETWTPEQIAMWQASFDALLSGNLELKSKVRFVPGGTKPFELKGSAGELLKCDYDEWITRIMCFAFRIDPKPFVKEPQPRANAEQQSQTNRAQGLKTEMTWWSCVMNELLTLGWGYDDIKHVFNEDEETAATDQATIDTAYAKIGARTINEIRARDGLDPVEGGDVALIYTASGAVPLDRVAAGEQMDMAQQATQARTQQPQNEQGKARTEKAASGLPFPRRTRSLSFKQY